MTKTLVSFGQLATRAQVVWSFFVLSIASLVATQPGATLAAPVGYTFSHAGRIVDSSGAPKSGSLDITATLPLIP